MGVITEQMRRVCRQHNRQEFTRISILNKQNIIIGQLEGKCIEGSISIDNSSYMRRSCSLKLILENTLIPNQNSFIWTNKKVKLEIGIKNLLTDEIVWFPMGIYLLKTAQMNYSSTNKEIDLTLLDLIANFSGDINGTLETGLRIASQGVSISQAIRSIVVGIGGENNVLIEDFKDDSGNLRLLPYTLNKQVGNNLLDALKELIELYKYQDIYYDKNGIFVAEHTKTLLSDDITEDFRDIDFTITSQVTNNFDYIKNYVKVLGISVQPMVSIEDVQSTSNPTPTNDSEGLKIIFNKPLYDSVGNRIINGADVKSYFEYNGISNNYISAVYNNSDWSVTFVINGENGKTLKPVSNMIFDSSQIDFNDGGYVYSSIDGKWSRILVSTVITDGINNTIQFQLNFNKALYDKNSNPIVSGTDLKSSFYYADGLNNSGNFTSAIYTIDNGNYYITLSFTNPILDMTIQINKDGINNINSLYDSTGLIYRTESYIMDGNTWTKIIDDSSLITQYQITAELSNTDVNSPYSISNIGEKRILVVNDQSIYTKSQALNRATYELQIHSNLNSQVSLNCLAIYWLDVNQLIYLLNETLGIEGKYRIDKISYNLKEGTMSMNCSKLYM